MVSDAFTPINSSFSFCNIDRESWCGSEIKNQRMWFGVMRGATVKREVGISGWFPAFTCRLLQQRYVWTSCYDGTLQEPSGSVFTRYSQTFVRLRIRCKYRDGSQREFTERFVLTSKSLFYLFFLGLTAPWLGWLELSSSVASHPFFRSTQSPPPTQWIQCTNENSPGLC